MNLHISASACSNDDGFNIFLHALIEVCIELNFHGLGESCALRGYTWNLSESYALGYYTWNLFLIL